MNLMNSCAKSRNTLRRIVLTSSSTAIRYRFDATQVSPLKESQWTDLDYCKHFKVRKKFLTVASILAMEEPKASGRIICSSSVAHWSEIIEMRRTKYPLYPFETKYYIFIYILCFTPITLDLTCLLMFLVKL